MQDGIWEGILKTASDHAPQIKVLFLDDEVEGVDVDKHNDGWRIRIPIPRQAITDGIQTILIKDDITDQLLNSISLVSGDPLADDLRAEVSLLRAELDLLKRSFRKYLIK
ncbi:hypothetical protein [Pseudaestuariivita rosea]|uniref:hypothetical protein n=1 Tax=Pseudaestuariivita rosea TaxID=2763263 RepID=UPI001F2A99BA|nr:hypothetical protein [Pseudaestuariivita rosea]